MPYPRNLLRHGSNSADAEGFFFTQDSVVEDLFCGASPGSEPCLFFSNNIFSLEFEPVQDDFQHDFTWTADDANGSVIRAELSVALSRECNY